MQVDPSDVIFRQFSRVAEALAAPSRLKLLDRLCQGEQTVEQLAQASGLSISNTSRQLRLLAESRLASVRRDPPRVYYRVASDDVTRFWFALRDLARSQNAELERVLGELHAGDGNLLPIGRNELQERMATGEVVLLDVRPAPEYQAGHLPGAVSIPLEELDRRLAELPSGREIVAYCRGPYCVLSIEAAKVLRSAGRRVVRLEDGVPEWRAAGLPVEVVRR